VSLSGPSRARSSEGSSSDGSPVSVRASTRPTRSPREAAPHRTNRENWVFRRRSPGDPGQTDAWPPPGPVHCWLLAPMRCGNRRQRDAPGSCDLVPSGAGVAAAPEIQLKLRRQPLPKRQRPRRYQSPVTPGPNSTSTSAGTDIVILRPRASTGQAARASDAVRYVGRITGQRGWSSANPSIPDPRPGAMSLKPPSGRRRARLGQA
jgi:hypothetical protein